jgi:hypothetical protein
LVSSGLINSQAFPNHDCRLEMEMIDLHVIFRKMVKIAIKSEVQKIV